MQMKFDLISKYQAEKKERTFIYITITKWRTTERKRDRTRDREQKKEPLRILIIKRTIKIFF